MKKVIICLLILLCIFPFVNVYAEKEEDEINVTKKASSSILMDYATGTILYNKEANTVRSVASLTKMMGLIVIFETMEKGGIDINEVLTTSKNAKEMGGSQIWLEEGEKISVNDLIKGVVMASANDAMVALAERISGTEEAFVNKMNQKVKELGLKNTNFVNCTGLDEENHYSTAYDMAIIAKELISHEKVLEYTSVYEDYIREDTANKTWLSNTNKLVRFYEGADGLKTGLTDEAGSCMAVTAKRNGLRLIAITLGYTESKDRNSETMDLLDYGFNQYKARVLYNKGDIVGVREIDKADTNELKFVAKEDITILKKKTEEDKDYEYEIITDEIKFPIKKDSTIGTLYVKENGEIKIKAPLVALTDVNKESIIKLYFKSIRNALFD